MAHVNATRVGDFNQKKLLSQMVIELNADTVEGMAAGNYKVANLPEDCIVQNAYAFVTKTGAGGPLALGTTEAGTDLLSAIDVNTATGETGTFADKVHTGTGKPVYMTVAAAITAEAVIVIEYIELTVRTGSMTRVDTKSA